VTPNVLSFFGASGVDFRGDEQQSSLYLQPGATTVETSIIVAKLTLMPS
jgi:hypothetical protein